MIGGDVCGHLPGRLHRQMQRFLSNREHLRNVMMETDFQS
jgi:hypothetical protein